MSFLELAQSAFIVPQPTDQVPINKLACTILSQVFRGKRCESQLETCGCCSTKSGKTLSLISKLIAVSRSSSREALQLLRYLLLLPYWRFTRTGPGVNIRATGIIILVAPKVSQPWVTAFKFSIVMIDTRGLRYISRIFYEILDDSDSVETKSVVDSNFSTLEKPRWSRNSNIVPRDVLYSTTAGYLRAPK